MRPLNEPRTPPITSVNSVPTDSYRSKPERSASRRMLNDTKRYNAAPEDSSMLPHAADDDDKSQPSDSDLPRYGQTTSWAELPDAQVNSALAENAAIERIVRESLARSASNTKTDSDTTEINWLLKHATSAAQGVGTTLAGDVLGTMFGHGPLDDNLTSAAKHIIAPDSGEGLSVLIDPNAIASMGINSVLGMGSQRLFSDLWGLDSDSSAGEVAAHAMAQKIVAYLQKEVAAQLGNAVGLNSACGPLSTLFGVGAAPATPKFPALSVGHLDDKGNSIMSGLGSVLVEGRPIARVGDAVDKAGRQLFLGSGSVSSGALPTGMASISQSAPAHTFQLGAATVFVGGPVVGPVPVPAPVAGAISQAVGSAGASGVAAGAAGAASKTDSGEEKSDTVDGAENQPDSAAGSDVGAPTEDNELAQRRQALREAVDNADTEQELSEAIEAVNDFDKQWPMQEDGTFDLNNPIPSDTSDAPEYKRKTKIVLSADGVKIKHEVSEKHRTHSHPNSPVGWFKQTQHKIELESDVGANNRGLTLNNSKLGYEQERKLGAANTKLGDEISIGCEAGLNTSMAVSHGCALTVAGGGFIEAKGSIWSDQDKLKFSFEKNELAISVPLKNGVYLEVKVDGATMLAGFKEDYDNLKGLVNALPGAAQEIADMAAEALRDIEPSGPAPSSPAGYSTDPGGMFDAY